MLLKSRYNYLVESLCERSSTAPSRIDLSHKFISREGLQMIKTITMPTSLILISDLGMQFANEESKIKRRYGIYKCQCGNEFKAQTRAINSGNTKSCGCYNIKIITTHGLYQHKIYTVWQSMIARCNNINNISYSRYGDAGIKVCERWMHSFENFRDDMLPTWQEGLSIDRINNNGNYEPSNCRWTTRNVQNRNTRCLNSKNTSGYRGVSFNKQLNKWQSGLYLNNKRRHIGVFLTAIEAAKAYDTYIIKNNLEHTINGVLHELLR